MFWVSSLSSVGINTYLKVDKEGKVEKDSAISFNDLLQSCLIRYVATCLALLLPPFFPRKRLSPVALAQQGLRWAVVLSVATGVSTLAVFVWAGYRIFWGKPFVMWAPMPMLAGSILHIGPYPQILHPTLNSATQSILHIWGGGGFKYDQKALLKSLPKEAHPRVSEKPRA